MYVPSNKKTEYRTLDGLFVEPVQPGNIPDTREFINKYQDIKVLIFTETTISFINSSVTITKV